MNKITVKNVEINVTGIEDDDFISLTDIARFKNEEDPNAVIANWIRRVDSLQYLTIWERLNNENFKPTDFEGFRSKPGENAFTISPKKWIEITNAIGIKVKSGRHGGGTFAHRDIALEFASWISAEIKLYIIKEFQRLKIQESEQLEWHGKRLLTKLNYLIHTDAVKEYLVPVELSNEQKSYIYANEADLLNVALFGQTAKQWKNNNPGKKGNVRDDANLNQLLVLANMESYNAILIEQGKSQSERLILLRNLAIRQMDTLASINLSAVSTLPGGDM